MKHANNQRALKVFLICVMVLSGIIGSGEISEAIAKEFFVAASNGKDGNNGAKEAPFLTLKKGVSVLSPGDKLFVRAGIYLGSSSLSNIPSGNSWAESVTIKAYQKEKVVFTAEPGKTVLQFKRGNHHIIVDSLIIDGKGGNAGIATGFDSHHIRVLNSEVMNATKTGVITGTGSSNFEFINLRVHDNGTTDFDHGFYITTSHHLVKDCSIYRNSGWGMTIYSGRRGNKPSFNLVMNNKIYDNAWLKERGYGIGIESGAENTAINNLIWGSLQSGIHINYGATDSKVYNNTIYGSRMGIMIGPGSTGSRVVNNISYNNTSHDLNDAGVKTILKNNLTENPQFFDAANGDFHIHSGSLAIKAGGPIHEVTTDFDYKLRPTDANYDIGAFQSGNFQIAPNELKVLSVRN